MNTIKYYFFILKNDLSSHKTTWKNPKFKLLNKSSQFEKVIYYVIPAKWHSEKDKTMEKENRLVIVRVLGVREGLVGWSTEEFSVL